MTTIDRPDPARWMTVPVRFGASAGCALRHWLARRWQGSADRPEADVFDDLADLDARTLADIGAPERLLARAMARRDRQREERDHLGLGVASGAWRQW